MMKLTLVSFAGKSFFVNLPVDEKGKVHCTYGQAWKGSGVKNVGQCVGFV